MDQIGLKGVNKEETKEGERKRLKEEGERRLSGRTEGGGSEMGERREGDGTEGG